MVGGGGLAVMVVPLKLSLVIESAIAPVTEWFATSTTLADCCTALTGARPTLVTLTIESPETSITMALPGFWVRSSVTFWLIDTTECAADGLGNVGGFGMIIGRKVSPHPLQIT